MLEDIGVEERIILLWIGGWVWVCVCVRERDSSDLEETNIRLSEYGKERLGSIKCKE